MDVLVRDEEVAAYTGPAVVVAVPSGEAPLDGPAAAVDAALWALAITVTIVVLVLNFRLSSRRRP